MQSGKLGVNYAEGKVKLDYEIAEGQSIELSIPVAPLLKPSVQHLKDQIDSGAIDLVKGTDIDKEVADKVLEQILALA